MAIRRTSNNSINNAVKLSTGFASAAIPNTPTIGTATAVSDVAATVEYTAAVLGATGTTFTATSNPGSVTGTGSSPITVTGLTASTAYTFTVTAGNANGTSAASSASNSITTSAPLAIDGYVALATATVTSGGASEVIFSDIPNGYKHLEIFWSAKTTRTGNSLDELSMQFNGDTSASNYYSQRFFNQGSDVAQDQSSTGFCFFGLATTSTASSGIFGSGMSTIPDYSSTTKKKTVTSVGGFSNQANNGGSFNLGGLWFGTNAINQIKIFSPAANIVEHSKFYLYGIK